MIEIKKTMDNSYYISINVGKLTILVDTLKDRGNGTIELWDNGNYIGRIWNPDNVKTEGFTFEELK